MKVVTYSRKVFIPLTTLCRDVCGYCVFARPPDRGGRYLEPDEAVAIAEAGRRVGCKEALVSLGERPEDRWPEARAALRRFGCATTIEYVERIARRVLERTGLLPHVNAGALGEDEIRALRPVSPSMGMMLESVSDRLVRPGGPHHAAPDKTPRRRLATLEAAGRARVPFTTGILVGIGETRDERIASLEAIADVHRRHGHIQEVIVQNFRAKAGTAMASAPEPSVDVMIETIAAARSILPPDVAVQAPPNLMPGAWGRYLDAGLDDWGGISPVTIDHINPERAWPKVDEVARVSAARGFALRERLAVYPRYITEPGWIDDDLRPAVEALAGPDGLARRPADIFEGVAVA